MTKLEVSKETEISPGCLGCVAFVAIAAIIAAFGIFVVLRLTLKV